MMTIEEKIAMLEDVMDLDEGELKLDSVLAEFEEWDSLSKLSLIAMAKTRLWFGFNYRCNKNIRYSERYMRLFEIKTYIGV